MYQASLHSGSSRIGNVLPQCIREFQSQFRHSSNPLSLLAQLHLQLLHTAHQLSNLKQDFTKRNRVKRIIVDKYRFIRRKWRGLLKEELDGKRLDLPLFEEITPLLHPQTLQDRVALPHQTALLSQVHHCQGWQVLHPHLEVFRCR